MTITIGKGVYVKGRFRVKNEHAQKGYVIREWKLCKLTDIYEKDGEQMYFKVEGRYNWYTRDEIGFYICYETRGDYVHCNGRQRMSYRRWDPRVWRFRSGVARMDHPENCRNQTSGKFGLPVS